MSSRSSRSRDALRNQRGFNLLEVLVAFAILAFLTAWTTQNFVENVDKAVDALSHRELREAADTIFRKMIYETEEYKDGDEGTLDEIYGEFARLKRWQRDRWAIYRFHLSKKITSVVGTSQEADENLFGEDTGSTSGSTTDDDDTTSGSEGTTEGEGGEGQAQGIDLMKMVLKIFRVEDESEQPLVTLVTWYDPNRGQLSR